MAGKAVDCRLLFSSENTVYGLPFVILIFAHGLCTLQYLQDFIRPVDSIAPPAGNLAQQAGLDQLTDQALSAREIDL
jgi:hypothetical protein